MSDRFSGVLNRYSATILTADAFFAADNILGEGWGHASMAVAQIASASSALKGEALLDAFSDLGKILLSSDFGENSSAAELGQAIAHNMVGYCGISAAPESVLDAYEGKLQILGFEFEETALGRVVFEAFETVSSNFGLGD